MIHPFPFPVRQPAISINAYLALDRASMSHLQRSFAKSKLASLPLDPPLPPHTLAEDGHLDEESDHLQPLAESIQDEDSSSASSASSASSTGTIKPLPSKHLFARPKGFVHLFPLVLSLGALHFCISAFDETRHFHTRATRNSPRFAMHEALMILVFVLVSLLG